MNLSRCENGHFYDKEKFSSCPHCAQGAKQDNDMTSVFTESLDDTVSSTQSANMANMDFFPATEALPETGRGGSGIFPDLTETMDNVGNDNVIGTKIENTAYDQVFVQQHANPGAVFDDDDHTQAFYDDLFIPKGSQNTQTAAVIKTPRVTTPCTGWLVAVDGSHIGQDFRLKAGKNFIGRDVSMDIALDGDKSVSRNKHAILVYEPKQHLYLIQPGESSELVYLNNKVVLSPTGIKAYDMITVGEVNLLFIPLCGERFNWNDVLKKK